MLLFIVVAILLSTTLQEGFQTTPSSPLANLSSNVLNTPVTDLTGVVSISINTGTPGYIINTQAVTDNAGLFKRYTVFDPTAAYIQLGVAQIEYPIMANFLAMIETGNSAKAQGVPWTPPTLTGAQALMQTKFTLDLDAHDPTIETTIPGTIRMTQGYNFLAAISQPELDAAIKAKDPWTYGVQNPVSVGVTMVGLVNIDTFCLTLVQNINVYYKNLLSSFTNHPIRFIVSGLGNGPSNLNSIPTKYGKTTYRGNGDIIYTPPVITKHLKQHVEMQTQFAIPTTILSDVNWAPKSFLAGDSAALINQFNGTRNTSTTNQMYKAIDVSGTITRTAMDEINKSIQYSIYFNLTDTSAIESQLRIHPAIGAHKFQFCPTFNGVNEWEQYDIISVGQQGQRNTKTLGVRTNAAKVALNNSLHIDIDDTFLFYLTHQCRKFILEWAIAKKTVIMQFYNEPIQPSDLEFEKRQPIFNLLNTIPPLPSVGTPPAIQYPPSTSRTYLIPSEIHAVLDAIAQCHYLYSDTNGKRKISKFLDVFQVGDTLFDVRYREIVSVSTESYAEQVNKLKDDYNKYVKEALSDSELTALDTTYTREMAKILGQTSNKFLGNATNCGEQAQYIRITARGAFPIQLSQIVVINTSGTNIALGQAITAKSVKLSEQASTANHIYNVNSTVNMEIKRQMDAREKNDTLNLLVDGTMTSRVNPKIYTSVGSNSDEYIEIGLGAPDDVTAVQLILPYGATQYNYTVTLYSDSTRTNPKIKDTSNALLQGSTSTNTVVVANFIKGTGTSDSIPCPTSILRQYKVARFYAKIDPGYTGPPPGTAPDVTKIKFTGFTEGIGAAHSFNPMYNGGIQSIIDSPAGNLIYVPKIKFTRSPVNPAVTSMTCSSPDKLIQIMNDYRRSVPTRTFLSRKDVKIASPAYTTANEYYPIKVIATAQISDLTCAIKWVEVPVDTITRMNGVPITRVGKFVYSSTTQNFSFTDTVYDISQSLLYASEADYTGTPALTPLATELTLSIPYATSYTLDTANGYCPPTDCADPSVINQLVKWYNTVYIPGLPANNNQPILVVNKAVTPNANECQLRVILGKDNTYTEKDIFFKFAVQYDVNAQYPNPKCKYVINTDGTGVGVGNLINDSTPSMSSPYSYVVEVAKPYTAALSSSVSSLLSYVAPVKTQLQNVLRGYRADTYGAFGQIQTLEGCDVSENVLNKCSNPVVMNQFLSYYNDTNKNIDILTSILRAGTASSKTCDFTYTKTNLNGANGQTSGLRCIMRRSPGPACMFDVSECAVIDPQPPIDKVYDTNYKLTTANTYSSQDVTYATSPTTNATVPLLPSTLPYANSKRISPLNYIDCNTIYALKQMNARGGLPDTITHIVSEGIDTCLIKGTTSGQTIMRKYVFDKVGNMYITNTAPAIPASVTGVALNPSIQRSSIATTALSRGNCAMPVPFTTTTPNLETVSGLQGIIKAIDISGAGIREYRVAVSDYLPFTSTYKRVSFYNGTIQNFNNNDCATVSLCGLQDGSEATSPFTYFNRARKDTEVIAGQSLIYSSTGGNAVMLVENAFSSITSIQPFITGFRNAWNATYCKAGLEIQKWLGKIDGYGYDPATDGVVFKMKCVYFGKWGPLDVRNVFTNYIRVVYRQKTDYVSRVQKSDPPLFIGSTGATTADTFVYSMTELAAGTPIPAISNYNDTVWNDDTTYSIGSINTLMDPLKRNTFRMLRFTPLAAQAGRAEVTRLLFYSMYTGGAVQVLTTPALITFPNPTVTVADISANYIKSSDAAVQCQPGFTPVVSGDNTVCTANRTSANQGLYTYPKGGGVCGIGYVAVGANCTTTTIFNSVLENPNFIANVSNGTPRLRLNLGQPVVISYDTPLQVDGFSLITGSAATVPTQFTVEGSINGITWKTVVAPTGVNTLNYIQLAPAVLGGIPILSFFYPGIFSFPRDTVTAPATLPAAPPPAPYMYGFYGTQVGNITEGFVSAPEQTVRTVERAPPTYVVPHEERIHDSYTLPLKTILTHSKMYTKPASSVPHPVEFKQRTRYLRFRTLETVDPSSKFVAMSQFTLHTRNGIIPSNVLTFTNMEGSRKKANEGPDALSMPWNDGRRWVDYNKSPLLIKIDVDVLPAEPITGYQFYIPVAEAAPIRWVLEGSADGRSWTSVHEMKTINANFLREYSPVYKFANEI